MKIQKELPFAAVSIGGNGAILDVARSRGIEQTSTLELPASRKNSLAAVAAMASAEMGARPEQK